MSTKVGPEKEDDSSSSASDSNVLSDKNNTNLSGDNEFLSNALSGSDNPANQITR